VLALAVPFVFLHTHYQPHVHAGQVDVDLTDLAILAGVLAAVWRGLREGFDPLRSGRGLWTAIVAFLAFLVASTGWAHAADPSYSLSTNLVSAAKFVEYAFLAPAVPLALRTRADRRLFYTALVGWSGVMTVIALLQFFGAIAQFRGRHPLDREPSYLGEHEFAAFSGAALSFAFAGVLLARDRTLAIAGGIAGGIGVALAAAIDAVGGMWVAAFAAWGLARTRTMRRTLAVAGIAAVVTIAAFTLRSSAIGSFFRFLGVKPNTTQTSGSVQTWSQRVLLGYVGAEIWLRHPVIGVGWQESMRPHAFEPTLAGARKHFASKQPPIAFPSPQHMWGVQNGVVQVLADLGIVGLLLLAAVVWQAFRLAGRVRGRAPPERLFELLAVCGLLIVGFAVFTGTGLLAGRPDNSQLWLGLGLLVSLTNDR
jgi:hypothetical protein